MSKHKRETPGPVDVANVSSGSIDKSGLPEELRDRVKVVTKIVGRARKYKPEYDTLFRWIMSRQGKHMIAISGFLKDPKREYKSLYPTFERKLLTLAVKMDYVNEDLDTLRKTKTREWSTGSVEGFKRFKNEVARLRVGKIESTDTHSTLFIEKCIEEPVTV